MASHIVTRLAVCIDTFFVILQFDQQQACTTCECVVLASLLQYFSRFGEVLDCVVVTNPTTGKSRGFGFVNFKDPSCVETVLAAGPHVLDGKQVHCCI